MKAGLLVNPGAARGGGKGEELVRRFAGADHILIRRLYSFDSLHDVLTEFAASRIDILAISSGDGTVQAVLTELGERSPFAVPPHMLLLPHGTTNMTAANIGFRSRGIAAQAAFLLAPAPRETVTRTALRLVNPGDGRPRQGMFFGAGAITVAAQYCQTMLNRRGFGGDLASGLTLAAALAASAMGRDLGIDHPHEMTLTSNGVVHARGPQLLLLASTLDRLILGSRPFWGDGRGAMSVTFLAHPFPGKLRWIWPLLYGGKARSQPPGAKSFRAAGFELATAAPLMLDGEFFDPPAGAPLRVETGVSLSYIRA